MPVKSWLSVLGVASVVGLLAGQPALAILGRCSDFGTSSGYPRMQNFRASNYSDTCEPEPGSVCWDCTGYVEGPNGTEWVHCAETLQMCPDVWGLVYDYCGQCSFYGSFGAIPPTRPRR